jgi:hypothetical protein
MPSRSSQGESPFLFVAFDSSGAVKFAHVFYSPSGQATRAVQSRALIAGVTKYQAFRIVPGKGDNLEFERL